MVSYPEKLGDTVRRFRVARHQDLPAIYGIQNIPFREKTVLEPLPPEPVFLEAAIDRMVQGTAYYYLLEQNGTPIGFTEYLKQTRGWQVAFWGKWLNTLVYASGKTAFEHLGFEKLIGYVRHANRRMMRTYQRFGVRITGQDSVFNIREGFSFIAVGKLSYYEITAEEFRRKAEAMKEQALSLSFDWCDF